MPSDASQARKHRAGLMELLLVLEASVWGSRDITTKPVVTAAPVLWVLTARVGIAAVERLNWLKSPPSATSVAAVTQSTPRRACKARMRG